MLPLRRFWNVTNIPVLARNYMWRKTQINTTSFFDLHSSRTVGSWDVFSHCLHTSASKQLGLKITDTSVSAVAKEALSEENENNPESLTFDLSLECEKLFEKIADGNVETMNKLKMLKLKMDLISHNLGITPVIKEENWRILNDTQGITQMKYMKFLIKVALLKKKRKEKVKLKMESKEKEFAELNADELTYALFKNARYMRIRERSMKHMYWLRSMRALMHSEEIIIDLQYEKHMAHKEMHHLAKQILAMIAQNNRHSIPFKIIFCNLSQSPKFKKEILRQRPTFFDAVAPYELYEGGFTDLFPPEKLVYLSPHSPEMLEEYDTDKKYIIGGFVDHRSFKPLSLAVAKDLGIEAKKFPIDKYLNWGIGQKNLALNHCLQIMLDLRASKSDWKEAFNCIPPRFLWSPEVRNKMAKTRKESGLALEYLSI